MTTANLNPTTRTLVKWARNNAHDEAVRAGDNGELNSAQFSRGMVAAFDKFLAIDTGKGKDNAETAYLVETLEPSNRGDARFLAGYRKAARDLARLA